MDDLEEEQEETEQNRVKRNPDGTFVEGTAPGPGRPVDTLETIIIKRTIKELVADYKESLADVLPALSPVLKEKALSGDVSAIRELHDRIMDKPAQSSTMKVELPPIPIDDIKNAEPQTPR